MGYKTKKDVLSSIARRVRGDRIVYDAYLGYNNITKKQVRIQKSDLKELKQAIEDFFESLKTGGDFSVMLKPFECVDARKAYDLLYAANCRLTLEEIVSRHLLDNKPKVNEKRLGDAYDEYLTTFTKDQALHLKAVRCRVGRFVHAFGRQTVMSKLESKKIHTWLEGNCPAAKTYNNYFTYIKTFLFWCMKKERAYLTENPLADSTKKTIAYKEPEYLHSADAVKLFRLLESVKDEHPEYLIYATLSFFCGIRREEILRMASMPEAANVNLEDETIRIAKPKGWTKGIAPRAFHVVKNALQWLRLVPYDKTIVKVTEATTGQIYDLAEKHGISIPKNAGRHTFITMHVAAYGDPQKTEAMAGTSKQMRVSNYCGLASHKEGEEYFSIVPSALS